ncbi:MAG: DUF2971 domain-containing protein [Clostridia bacterium]|nr:DUF2971 domain-containing protein [Clostridia bacterium]
MLYRFRTIDKLIGEKYKELKDQYFFFASPSTLNDPLEGYVDFYWKADNIAWLGLFKNYVWQVYRTLKSAILQCPLDDMKKMYFTRTEIHLKETQLPQIRKEIEDRFSNEPIISEISTILGESEKEINQPVLHLVLSLIHLLALFHANKWFESKGIQVFHTTDWLIKKTTLIKSTQYKKIVEIVKGILANEKEAESILILDQNIRFDAVTKIGNIPKEAEISEYILFDFPEHYTKHVVNLAYENWQTVCFNRSYSDPKMWSHYANNHTGVCLMFEFNSAECVQLEALNSLSGDKTKRLYIKPVDYTSPPLRINFFLTLGNLWGDERTHWFYRDNDKSTILNSILKNVEKWRDEYWSNFEKRFLHKGSAWKSEEEERIILDDSLYDHLSPDQKKYKYDFNKLHGIIFGINTKLSDKKELIKILKEKCIANKREQFHIYQARYDAEKESIVADLVLIIKNNSN